MIRQGRYTKKHTFFYKTHVWLRLKWHWFLRASILKKALVVCAPVLLFLCVTPLLTFVFYYNDIADKDRLMNSNNTGVVFLDVNGQEFYELGNAKHREYVKLTDISDVTKQALLASEDKNFYSHAGFSLVSIVGALYANIVAGDSAVYGGSTLTQQLAKNTLLSSDRTFLRKYQELTIAMAIEQRYSKDEILEMYLNSVYFGNDSFGIAEAAHNYFGKEPKQLTLAQASMLIGVLPAPSVYSPVGGTMTYAKERQMTVLSRMVKNGVLTEEEKTAAYNSELTYQPVPVIDNVAPHFTEMVLRELYDVYGEEKVKRSGYQVTTTIDIATQKTANEAVVAHQARVEARGGSNASVVVIDPTSGQIRALVGSIDYNNPTFGKVNMATTKRQTGSSFKPIYYARAMVDDIIAPASVIRDEKTTFGDWTPKNASGRFYGDVSVRQALGWSLNIPAVKVMERVGIEKAAAQARAMGISTIKDTSQYGLTLALGSAEVPLVEMTNAYAVFANGGRYKQPTTIKSIENKFSKTIYTTNPQTTQAISQQGAYLISNVLSDTTARAAMFGSSLNVYGTDGKLKNVAVKTGTTDDSRDGWTIGYTPTVAVGVWVGNNDNTQMQSGGADMAGPIWKAIMAKAIGTDTPNFSEPTGVIKQEACINGVRVEDYFLLSTQLATSCRSLSTENSTPYTSVPTQNSQNAPASEQTPTQTTPEGETNSTQTPTSPTPSGTNTPGSSDNGSASGTSDTTTQPRDTTVNSNTTNMPATQP